MSSDFKCQVVLLFSLLYDYVRTKYIGKRVQIVNFRIDVITIVRASMDLISILDIRRHSTRLIDTSNKIVVKNYVLLLAFSAYYV